jgi:hypothetical protein
MTAPGVQAEPPAVETHPVVVSRQASETSPEAKTVWPMPQELIGMLEPLKQHAVTRPWAQSAMDLLERLQRVDAISSPEAANILDQLKTHAVAARDLSQQIPIGNVRSDLLRTKYALQRRVLVWQPVNRILARGPETFTVSLADDMGLYQRLEAVESRLSGSPSTSSWREYLLLDDLRALLHSGDARQRRAIAGRVLQRMESDRLTPQQRELLKEPEISDFGRILRQWVREPVDYERLLEDLELFEFTQSSKSAHQIAYDYQVARWSSHSHARQLAETLDTYYRNANLRVAVTGELINRLLPTTYSFEEDHYDNVLGAHVQGTSTGSSRFRVVLIPDESRWRMGLEAIGDVNSETVTTKGPATFYSDAVSRYSAQKLLTIDPYGIHAEEAEAAANSDIYTRGFRTTFDSIPLVRGIVRFIAARQHDRHYGEARRMACTKLECMACQRIDGEVQQQIGKAKNEFGEKWLKPLNELQLHPQALDMQTTDRRLVARYRLAGRHQLAAHTPRPQAPSDSFLSVQAHESALNNTIEQLGLADKRSELRSLYRELADIFRQPEMEIPEDVPDGVIIQFAAQDPIRVRFDEGRVTVTLRIRELKNGRRRRWYNFAVRAYYVPDATQLDANLVRDGYIELAGQRLNTFDQIALRGIFTSVLARNRPFKLINDQLAQNAELNDLQVTQFVINDGWVGVALGPQARQRDNDGGRETVARAR